MIKKFLEYKLPKWVFDFLFVVLIGSIIYLFNLFSQIICIKYDQLALTLFTVQASISVLGIAILSLLASSVKETYLGMKISTYFIEYQSGLFKSKSVIVFQLILIVVDVFLIAFRFSFIVPYILILSVMLTIRQVLSIIGIFKSFDEITVEIEDYYRRKLFKSKGLKTSKIFKSIEASDDFVSIYSTKKHAETVLRFYLSVQGIITIKNFPQIGKIFENSFSSYVKKYLDNNTISSIDEAFSIITESVEIYTKNGIININYAGNLIENFSDIFENGDDVELTNVINIMNFYRSYLGNLYKMEKSKKVEIALEVSTIPMRYLHLVFGKNRNFKGITKEKLESIHNGIFNLDYLGLDSQPFQRDFIIWLLLGGIDLGEVERAVESLLRTQKKNLSQFSNVPSSNVVAILIFIYQILFVSSDSLLKDSLMKPRIEKYILNDSNLQIYLMDLVYSKDELIKLDIENIESLISRWEFQAYQNVNFRDYYVDKSVAEFLVLLLACSNLSIHGAGDILLKQKIPGYSIERFIKAFTENEITNRIELFQRTFLGIDENIGDRSSDKINLILSYVLKEEFLKRYLSPIDHETENYFVESNFERLNTSIINSFASLSGTVSNEVNQTVFEDFIIDDLENCQATFRQFWVGYFTNRFKLDITKYIILPKVHHRKIEKNKEAAVNIILKHIKLVKVKTNTVIGYKADFFGYKNADKYRTFLANITNKIEIENNSNIIVAIDSNHIQLLVDEVELLVNKVSINDYIKMKNVSVDSDGNYTLNIGGDHSVSLSSEELRSYVDRRIRKITIRVKYRVNVSKDKIGNFIEFI